MSARLQFEKEITVAGEPAGLFVCSSYWDDYFEITLSSSAAEDGTPAWLPEDLASELDVRYYEGLPALVSVLVDYSGDPQRRALPERERLQTALAQLAEAMPALDFGDLLPRTPAAVRGSEDQPGEEGQGRRPEPPAFGADRPLERPYDATRCLERARQHAARGKLHKALRELETVLRHLPAHEEALDLRCTLKALEEREKNRRQDPHSARAHLEVGFSYLLLGRGSDAVEALSQASRLDPGLYLAHLLLGIALHRQGEAAAARGSYERAASLKPHERTPFHLLRALERGEAAPLLADSTPSVVRAKTGAMSAA